MVCLGSKPSAMGWKMEINRLSYGGPHKCAMDYSAFVFAPGGTAYKVNNASTIQLKIKTCTCFQNNLPYFL